VTHTNNAADEAVQDISPGWLREGLVAAAPIALGYFPLGMAMGVLGQKAGLSAGMVALMSLLVYAGSAQFIAVAMLGTGAGPGAIILTTFVVNFRHLLMSFALSVPLRGARRGFLSLFSYGITDETFAVNMTRFRQDGWDRRRALVVNEGSHLAWVGATTCGAWAGAFIPAGAFGIDYALVAMFLCLLVFQLQGRLYVLTALATAILSVVLYLFVPGNAYVVLASVGGATIGFLLQKRKNRTRRVS